MSLSASVIIPAYDEPVLLSQCLSALRDQTADEVVVAASDETTQRIAKRHAACDTVVSDDRNGAGAARNRAVDASSGNILLFTDADTIVPPDWVSTHRRHYADSSVIGVGGPARPLDGSTKDEILFKLLSDYYYRVFWPVGFTQLPTFNCSYRRSTFLEHDGFDEEIPFMEDTELSLRLRDAGELVYDAETRVDTSARRENTEGYVSVFLTYAHAYFSHYVLNSDFEDGYFNRVK